MKFFPRFTLRTLLVAVAITAVLSAWFAYHWRWIQRREATRDWILAHHGMLRTEGGTVIVTLPDGSHQTSRGLHVSKQGKPVVDHEAPLSLRLLGEKSVYFIQVFSFTPEREPSVNDLAEFNKKVAELAELFPEAEVFKDHDREPVR